MRKESHCWVTKFGGVCLPLVVELALEEVCDADLSNIVHNVLIVEQGGVGD